MSAPLRPSAPPWVLLPPLLAVVAAVLLRHATATPFGNDEAGYAFKVGFDWAHLWGMLASDNYPPLYFAFLKLWSDAFGLAEFPFRASSLPFALLLPAVGAWMAARMLEPRAWAVFALLLALSPFGLFLGGLAKYFALFGVLTLVMAGLVWRLALSPQPLRAHPGALVLLAGAGLALLWIHYLAVVVWCALGAWLLLQARKGPRALWLLGFLFVVSLFWMPQALVLLDQATAARGHAAVRIDAGVLRRLVAQLGYTAWSFPFGHTLEVSHLLVGPPGVLAFWLCAGAGALRAVRGGTPACRALRFCLVVGAFSLGGAFAILWFFLTGLPDLAVSERLAFALPFVLLLVAAGWVVLPRWGRWATALAFVLPWSMALGGMVRGTENTQWEYLIPWRSLAPQVEAVTPRPRTLVADSFHLGSRPWYYLHRTPEYFIELRRLTSEGGVAEMLQQTVQRGGTLILLRSTRDSSPDSQVDAFERLATERFGPPVRVQGLVTDSPSMRRLKEWFRRGSGVATLGYKLQWVEWRLTSPAREESP